MRCRSILSKECSILSGSRRSGNRPAKALLNPRKRSACRSTTKPPSLLTLPPLKLPSILLPFKPGNSKSNCLHSVIGEVFCWFVYKQFDPNRLHERLRYFFALQVKFPG